MFWRQVSEQNYLISINKQDKPSLTLYAKSVGILKFVKEHCTMQINAYDKCLSVNSEKPEECVQALKELYFCTEATSIAYRDEQKKKAEAQNPSKTQEETKTGEPAK